MPVDRKIREKGSVIVTTQNSKTQNKQFRRNDKVSQKLCLTYRFRKHVNLSSLVLVVAGVVCPKLDLRQDLVCEGVAHHEARMPCGAAQVDQATFGEQDHVVSVGELVAIHLDSERKN